MDASPTTASAANPVLAGVASYLALGGSGNGNAAAEAAGAQGTAKAGGVALAAGAAKTAGAGGDSVQLSPEAKALVAKLQARDSDVRAHEAAHVAAGGGLITGGISFALESGPDGRQYAVGGEVSIDTSAVAGDPRATLVKAQQIEAAALAPADPSGQDVSVASQAEAMAGRASAELAAGAGGQGGKGSAPRAGALFDLSA
jgi:hypothetical protein